MISRQFAIDLRCMLSRSKFSLLISEIHPRLYGQSFTSLGLAITASLISTMLPVTGDLTTPKYLPLSIVHKLRPLTIFRLIPFGFTLLSLPANEDNTELIPTLTNL